MHRGRRLFLPAATSPTVRASPSELTITFVLTAVEEFHREAAETYSIIRALKKKKKKKEVKMGLVLIACCVLVAIWNVGRRSRGQGLVRAALPGRRGMK